MSVTSPKGFVAAGLACGIKESGAPDLALVVTDDHAAVPAAGVFTSNLAQVASESPCSSGGSKREPASNPRRTVQVPPLASVAPVQVSRAHLADGRAAAVVLSSGNANAATGELGRRDARRMCELVGEGIDIAPADVLATRMIPIALSVISLVIAIMPCDCSMRCLGCTGRCGTGSSTWSPATWRQPSR